MEEKWHPRDEVKIFPNLISDYFISFFSEVLHLQQGHLYIFNTDGNLCEGEFLGAPRGGTKELFHF